MMSFKVFSASVGQGLPKKEEKKKEKNGGGTIFIRIFFLQMTSSFNLSFDLIAI